VLMAGRYRLNLMPALCALGGAGLAALAQATGRRRALAGFLAALVTAASLLFMHWTHPAFYSTLECASLANRALAYYQVGRVSEARVLMRRALADPRALTAGHRELARRLLTPER